MGHKPAQIENTRKAFTDTIYIKTYNDPASIPNLIRPMNLILRYLRYVTRIIMAVKYKHEDNSFFVVHKDQKVVYCSKVRDLHNIS